MLKFFYYVRDKIKERERDYRRREKELLMKFKFDEVISFVVFFNNVIEDFWCVFLIFFLGYFRLLIVVFVNGDVWFLNK